MIRKLMPVLLILSSCQSNFTDDSYKGPKLVNTPLIDHEVVRPGEVFTIRLEVQNEFENISVEDRSTGFNSLGTTKFIKQNNDYVANAYISCTAKSGDYYPEISIDAESYYAHYYPNFESIPIYYDVEFRDKSVVSVNGDSQNPRYQREKTNLLALKYQVLNDNLSAGAEPNVSILISDVIANESFLTVNYKFTNNGESNISGMSINAISKFDEEFSEKQRELLGFSFFYNDLCFHPGETITSSIIIEKPSELSKIVVEAWLHRGENGSDPISFISNEYSWH